MRSCRVASLLALASAWAPVFGLRLPGRNNLTANPFGIEEYIRIGSGPDAHFAPIYDPDDPRRVPFNSTDGRTDEERTLKTLADKPNFKIIAEHLKNEICDPEATKEQHEMHAPGHAAAPSILKVGSFYARYRDTVKAAGRMHGCSTHCVPPRYLPARAAPEGKQRIPRIIWMTIQNTTRVGPFLFHLMSKHWTKNPEYEWILVDDEAAGGFMNSSEVKPEWREAYMKAVNGAERADIWRYAVMFIYGGVYMDQDMAALKPLSRMIRDPDASIVQTFMPKHGVYEVSQFALLMAPGHLLMSTVLDTLARDMADHKKVETWKAPLLTGPGQLALAWVTVMNKFGRNIDNPRSECKGANLCSQLLDFYFDVSANMVCERPTSCDSPDVGKVVVLPAMQISWHKFDKCALMEHPYSSW